MTYVCMYVCTNDDLRVFCFINNLCLNMFKCEMVDLHHLCICAYYKPLQWFACLYKASKDMYTLISHENEKFPKISNAINISSSL